MQFQRIILFFIILIALTGCTQKQPAKTASSQPEIKNVILIGIDTLRAEELGFMGYDRPTSPFLDEFAKRCVVFERTYTPKSLTLPAFTSLLSGKHVINHKTNGNGIVLPKELHLLAEDFGNAGFLCLGFPAAEVISKKYGINKGFDYYSDISGSPGAQIPGSMVNASVRRFLEGNPKKDELSFPENDKPIFLFIHYFDTHTPYSPDASTLNLFADPDYKGPFDGGYGIIGTYNAYKTELDEADLQHCRDLYDSEIHILDRYIRELFTMFEKAGLIDNSIIAITADHGENLGEHHNITHGHPYEDGLHIPLMFHFPHDLYAGMRIDNLIECTDVLPTTMDAAGVPIPEMIDGRTLIPLMANPELPHPERNYLLALGGANDEKKTTYSVFDGTYRLIKDIRWSETSLFYNIMEDPHELTNIAADNPDLVKLYESIIVLMAAGLSPPDIDDAVIGINEGMAEIDPESEEMLRSLGYLN